MRKPLPLRTGDVIAVFAPAGPVDAGRLARGIARLSSAGFVPEIAFDSHSPLSLVALGAALLWWLRKRRRRTSR